MKQYKPGDMQKVIDTCIALDAAFTVLMRAISRLDRPLAQELVIELAHTIRVMPANLPGARDLVAAWKEDLQKPTSGEAGTA